MVIFNEAVQEFDSGNFGRALTLLRDELASDPNNASAQRLFAATCLKLERFEEAQSAARRYVQLRPDDAAGYQQLGQVYLRQQRIEEARESFEAALQRDPLNAEAKKELQRLSWRSGEQTAETPSHSATQLPSHPATQPSTQSSWHHLMFKSAVVIAAIAIVAAAFLPQWLGSRGTQADPNPPQRSLVNKPPEVAKSQRPNPQPHQQNPAPSSINEEVPRVPQQLSPEAQQALRNAAAQMEQQRSQQQGPVANGDPLQQDVDKLVGTNSGGQGRGKGGGSGSGLTACPICGGKGWTDCPGPATNSGDGLKGAFGSLFGGGRDICHNGRYRCPNHQGSGCEVCGMDDPEGLCPVCKGKGRLVCAICRGKGKIDPNAILSGLGNMK